MHFLRMYTESTLNTWDGKDETALARKVFSEAFGEKADSPSLYAVDSRMDEILTASAFALTTTKIHLENFFVVRLYWSDLEEFELSVDDDYPGGTGVVDVDFRHFEIRKMTKEKAVKLTQRIRAAACEGEERFRWIPAGFQRPHLQRFLLVCNGQVIDDAKRRCRLRLDCAIPSDSAGGKPHHIIKALEANKPTLPRFRIERAAHLNYCERIEKNCSGTPDEDWKTGEESLWESYKNAFR
jgi:hypothetical protein